MAALASKLWCRLLKVLFVFAYVCSLAFWLFLGWDDRPQTHVDNERTLIVCSAGTRFIASTYNIYFSSSQDITPDDDYRALRECVKFETESDPTSVEISGYGRISFHRKTSHDEVMSALLKLLPGGESAQSLTSRKFYSVQFAYSHEGSWRHACRTVVIGMLLTCLFFELIKRTFLYVAVGQKFFKLQRATEKDS